MGCKEARKEAGSKGRNKEARRAVKNLSLATAPKKGVAFGPPAYVRIVGALCGPLLVILQGDFKPQKKRCPFDALLSAKIAAVFSCPFPFRVKFSSPLDS